MNLAERIQDPHRALPDNAMPRMGVTPRDSRDITAFLYEVAAGAGALRNPIGTFNVRHH